MIKSKLISEKLQKYLVNFWRLQYDKNYCLFFADYVL